MRKPTETEREVMDISAFTKPTPLRCGSCDTGSLSAFAVSQNDIQKTKRGLSIGFCCNECGEAWALDIVTAGDAILWLRRITAAEALYLDDSRLNVPI